MGKREGEDQHDRRVVPVFSRQYDIIIDLDINSFVSNSRGDFVNLDEMPCGSLKTQIASHKFESDHRRHRNLKPASKDRCGLSVYLHYS